MQRVFLLGLLLLTACGSKSESTLNNALLQGANGTEQSLVKIEERMQAAQSGTLLCPFADVCEPAVALVSVVSEKGIERCTGFLISDDLLMTNDHCVLNSTALRAESCRGLIFAHFAKAVGTNHETLSAETASCQKIITRSMENGLGSKDYTLIQLDRKMPLRKPLKLANRGFADQEKASIVRVQMTSLIPSTYDGIQNELNCESTYQTLLYPGVTSSRSPLMTFGDCAIQHGNSGSPIFNGQHEVAGIVQGYLEVPQNPTLIEKIQRHYSDQISYGLVGVGTQVACISEINAASASRCSAVVEINGPDPEQYFNRFGLFNEKEMLPLAEPGTSWRALSNSDSGLKNYIELPHCLTSAQMKQTAIELKAVSYRKGFNHQLKVQWHSEYAEGIRKASFTFTQATSGLVLSNSEYGSFTIAACK